jgi:TetR/AcrR family transcriptional regulator, transcriptional repressor of aconitase
MPKVSQCYLDARRVQILDAAIVCFSRQGFHRTTMLDIVNQSKLSPGAIYNYFESKEEIIEAIAEERRAKEQALMAEAAKQATVAKVLIRIRDVFFGDLKKPEERRRRRLSVQLWAEAQRNPRILKLVRDSLNTPRMLLSRILSDAQHRGEISDQVDPEAAARFLIAVFHGLVLQVEWDNELHIEPQIQLLDIFLESIYPT